MKYLTPIMLIIGTLWSFNAFTYCWWVAGGGGESLTGKELFATFALVYGLLFMLSMLSWLAYGIALWRRKNVRLLGLSYLGLWVVLLTGVRLWVKFNLAG